MTVDVQVKTMRNITDDRILFTLEDAFPIPLNYQQLHEATGHCELTLRKSMQRLEELGFVKSGRSYNGKRGGAKKLFRLAGPEGDQITSIKLDLFFKELSPEMYLCCRLLFPDLSCQIRVEKVQDVCLGGCGVRIQCYQDNKERDSDG